MKNIYPEQRTFNSYELWNLCNEEELFTCGTEEQYNRMFDANDKGCSIKELAAMIWICSEDVSLDDVIHLLKKMKKAIK